MRREDLTTLEARRRLAVAKRASNRAAEAFAADELTQEEFWKILEAEEDLLLAAHGVK